MIIISQNKNTIINFERINYIEITKKDDHFYSIYLNFADSDWKNIGYYRTEERAKEILGEIVKTYLSYATVKNLNEDVRAINTIPSAYMMPKE